MVLVLGATLVAIGIFVFWCDVTDSWHNVFRWTKTRRRTYSYKFTSYLDATWEVGSFTSYGFVLDLSPAHLKAG